LKSGEEPIVDSFKAATVLFSDIADFTISAAQMSPTELVDLLNDLFSEFDSIVAEHNLEKIKTIGDAYMLAAGLPLPRQDHAAAVAAAALEMQERVRDYKFPNGLPVFLRIGIHTGPVVAGVIGKAKFSYDLWGDTVNTARRLEEMGSPGTIQISETTAKLIEADFKVERRGTVAVKGRGEVPVFLLTGTT
jgi:class 3 adenylate cyclase